MNTRVTRAATVDAHHEGEAHDGCHGQGDERDQVAMFVVGPIETNCYVYISEDECMVVDSGNSGVKIAEHLPDGVRVKYIFSASCRS